MRTHRPVAAVLVVAGSVLAACGRGGAGGASAPATTPTRRATITLSSGATTLTLAVEVASTPAQRERGLMARASVPQGTGMLFTYPSAQDWGGYWMKDTLVPLDIAFIRARSVFEIDHMVPCHTSQCPITTPSGPYDAALEVPAGTFAAAHIGPGATVAVTE
jgi:uncharacterized membrane protein (UPF0127 family)